MKSFIHCILTGIILCIALTGCEGENDYNYIVRNNSSQDIYLILHPDKNNALSDYDCERYGGSFSSYNGFGYSVTYLENEDKEIDCPLHSLSLKPGESVKFTYGEFGGNIITNPETTNTHAIWLRRNCLKQILIREDSEINNSELSYGYWSKSSNWIIQNKKSYTIDYLLIIDDEVIRNHRNLHRLSSANSNH